MFVSIAGASSIRRLVTISPENKFDVLSPDMGGFTCSLSDCGEFSGDIVRLNWSLYGLEQAPRRWDEFLVSKLEECGFEQIPANPCIARCRENRYEKVQLVDGTHVDDLTFVGKGRDCGCLCRVLGKTFLAINLGEVKLDTGCSFGRDEFNGTSTISQGEYNQKLSKTSMLS